MYSRTQVALLVVLLTGCSPGAERNRSIAQEVKVSRPAGIEGKVFEAVNAIREREGVPRLRWDSRVARVAESHSRAMAEREFFSHSDPEKGDLTARMEKGAVEWRAVAENLFQQRGCRDAVQCAVEGWLGSAGHRRNLLNSKFTHTGIGVFSDKRGTTYYTQIFVTP